MTGLPLLTESFAQPIFSDAQRAALFELLKYLERHNYHFVTVTPVSHERFIARKPRNGRSVEDVLGWSRAFDPGDVAPDLLRLLAAADVLDTDGALHRARIRVSSLHGQLFIHSAFPTVANDSVFLGPDSYRFADFIRTELAATQPATGATIVDIGTGAGVGAIVAAGLCPQANVVMTDLNQRALFFAEINAHHAGHAIMPRLGRDLAGHIGGVDVAMANPPYIIDPAGRAYRDGGAMHGAEISVAMTCAALDVLRPGGRLILYTGSAIIGGEDRLKMALQTLAGDRGYTLRYREIDPDVFGEELDNPGYEEVDRIAVVAAIFTGH